RLPALLRREAVRDAVYHLGGKRRLRRVGPYRRSHWEHSDVCFGHGTPRRGDLVYHHAWAGTAHLAANHQSLLFGDRDTLAVRVQRRPRRTLQRTTGAIARRPAHLGAVGDDAIALVL